jgi:dienelactone hydrolase
VAQFDPGSDRGGGVAQQNEDENDRHANGNANQHLDDQDLHGGILTIRPSHRTQLHRRCARAFLRHERRRNKWNGCRYTRLLQCSWWTTSPQALTAAASLPAGRGALDAVLDTRTTHLVQHEATMTLTLVERDAGIVERHFEVSVGEESVPGLLWSPDGSVKPEATVLLGHGRTGDKRNPYLLALAQRLAGRGWNAVAIDASGHGERRAPDAGSDWPRPDADEATRDWHAAIDYLRGAADLNTERLGYWGLSMGAALGISLIAGDHRIRAAVLGLSRPNWPSPPGTRVRADAATLACPVLFLVNWDDRLVPRSQSFELFDLIGSSDKRLHAYRGDHYELPDEAITASEVFFARYLKEP